MGETPEKFIKQVASAPAIVIDTSINVSKEIGQAITEQKPLKKMKEYWHILGPGFTTGAADDDPSGIATYSQQGSQFGLQLLWLAPLTFPLMSIVQEMCGRIGLVTGRGLAANIRRHYPRWVLYLCTMLLLTANTLNLGADLGAMAKATQLIIPNTSTILLVIGFAVFSLLLQIYTTYKNYSKYLKYLALILLAYVFSTFSVPNINWKDILIHAITPSLTFSKEQIFLITGILGTTISPYLFFWQPSQELEEEILKGKTTILMREKASDEEVKNMRIDVWSGMFISNLVMFFIITACSATLFTNGITNINTAADAAAALKPFAGENASLVFALGIIGAGLLALPILAGSASYAISESFRWKHGLNRELKEASAFYGIIIIAMGIGIIINLLGLDPIKVLIYSAVLNGLIAPIILFFIVKISSSKKVMGERKNSFLTSSLGWLIALIMVASGIATIVSFFLN